MTDTPGKIKEFLNYARTLKGYEKGEAQVFCDRLFQAFGHRGYHEAHELLHPPCPSLKGGEQQDKLTIAAIVGMGGVGKTEPQQLHKKSPSRLPTINFC
jgi:hypothetical protein